MDIKDLLYKRGQIIDQMKNMLDKAEKEGRDLSGEEQTQYDAMHADQASLKVRADRLHQAGELQSEINANTSQVKRTMPVAEGGKPLRPRQTDEYVGGFENYCRVGRNGLSYDVLNALQVGTDSEGGYIVPEEFETQLVEYMQDINPIRQYVTVVTTASDRNIPIES